MINMTQTKKTILKIIKFTIVLTMIFSITGCGNPKKNITEQFYKTLRITGDVTEDFSLNSLDNYETIEIKINEENYNAIKLSDVLENIEVTGDDNLVYLDAYDGVLASFSLENVNDQSYLYYNNGWCFFDENFPKQTRMRDIKQIVIHSQTIETMTPCFRIIYDDQVISKSYGDLFVETATTYLVTEGEPVYNNNSATALTRRSLIPLEKYLDNLQLPEEFSLVGYFKDGSETEIDANGYLEYRGNSVDYIGTDLIDRQPNMIGVFVDPPKSIHDIKDNILNKIEDHQKVIAIELDGVGYYNMLEIKPPYLSQFNLQKYRTVFPSISNVSLAAFMTGLTPKENGITDKGMREVKSEDIFNELSSMNKTGIVVEGDTQLITMSVDQILSPDKDNKFETDNEVFDNAKEALKQNKDYTFVHFHGYDDVAHQYGPFSNEAYDKLNEIDGYVKELMKDFNGTLIIFADHGQHDVNYNGKLGNHGEFLPIDMSIPYIEEEIK